MKRQEVTLVMLSLAEGGSFTPVQIQKALFLASRKAPSAFSPGSNYDFQPYDYGPFDSSVYSDVEELERDGRANIARVPGSRWKTYSATPEGIRNGAALAENLSPEDKVMMDRIVKIVRSLSFSQLVTAIYKDYPEMEARSVFKD